MLSRSSWNVEREGHIKLCRQGKGGGSGPRVDLAPSMAADSGLSGSVQSGHPLSET